MRRSATYTLQRLASRRCPDQSGSALVEVTLISSFAALLMAGVPLIAEYGSSHMAVTAAARLNAWQRSVWFPKTSDNSGLDETQYATGAGGSIRKSDQDLDHDLSRHVFRNTRAPAVDTIHSTSVAEFSGKQAELQSYISSVSSSTRQKNLPAVTSQMDTVFRNIAKIQDTMLGKPGSYFNFITNGYFRTEVKLSRNAGFIERMFPTEFGSTPSVFHKGDPLPTSMTMTDHMTMLTDAWSGGGTNREEAKIQGLVLTKWLDLPWYADLRANLHQTSYGIKQVFPGFDVNNLLFGLTPGDAIERTPVDRFEWLGKVADESGASSEAAPRQMESEGNADPSRGGVAADFNKKDRFRFYRSFPPAPVVNTLP